MNNYNTLASISEVDNLVEKYGKFINGIRIQPVILIPSISILILFFIVRGFIWFKTCDTSSIKAKSKVYAYISEHCVIEFVISFAITYMLIVLTYADMSNYFLNYAFAPALGIIAAIFFDMYFIIPRSKYNSLEDLLKSDSSKKKSDDGTDINIVVNANGQETSKSHELSALDNDNIITKQELAEAENPNELFRLAINSMRECQVDQAKVIENQSKILNAIKNTMKTDKKIKLKELMYQCLDQGYATPDQNEVIVDEYHSYLSLDGNGEIKELYENHYLLLKIHK